MATMEAVTVQSFEAGGDLSAHQFKFVLVAADGQVDLNTTANDRVTGVLLNDPAAAGRAAEVAVAGRVKVITGAGGLTAGQLVASTNAGLAVLAAGAGTDILGRALTTAAAGELVEIQLGYLGII
jgi:hypothetical protein